MCLYDLGADYETHAAMHKISHASFVRNMDADAILTLEGRVEREETRAQTYRPMLERLFAVSQDLWFQGHDLLLVEADMLCMRPTPWPEGREMRLFNFADCKVPAPFPVIPRHAYLHSGVKFLPQTMPDYRWSICDTYVAKWRDEWAYDQFVWNVMFWVGPKHQYKYAAEYVDPRYCWCTPRKFDNLRVPREKAYIIHYHGTRGPQKCLLKMRRDAPRD